MTDIAPLGFSVDTSALEQATKAAADAAKSFREVGTSAEAGQKGLTGVGTTAKTTADALNQQAAATKNLKGANEDLARSADNAAAAQKKLADVKLTPERYAEIGGLPSAMRQKTDNYPNTVNPSTGELAAFYEQRRATALAAKPIPLASSPPPPGTPPGGGGPPGGGIDISAPARASAGALGLLGAAAGAAGAVVGMALVQSLAQGVREMIRMGDEAILLERRLRAVGEAGLAVSVAGIGKDAYIGTSEAGKVVGAFAGDRLTMEAKASIAPASTAISQLYLMGGGDAKGAGQFASSFSKMGSDGTINAGELDALNSQAPALVRAMADAYKVSADELERMARNGELFYSETLVRMAENAGKVDTEFQRMDKTFGETMGRLSGSIKDAIADAVGVQDWDDIWRPAAEGLIKALEDKKTSDGIGAAFRRMLMGNAQTAIMGYAFDLAARGSAADEGTQTPASTPASTPVAPAAGAFAGGMYPVAGGATGVSSGYGPRTPPTAGASANHPGIDIRGKAGDTIFSPVSGTVFETGGGPNSGLGNWLKIRDQAGSVSTYAHMRDQTTALQGSSVVRGSPIGAVGQTGTATGPHLHLEVTDPKGKRLNPTTWLSSLSASAAGRAAGPANPTSDPAVITDLLRMDPAADESTVRAKLGQIAAALSSPATTPEDRAALLRVQGQLNEKLRSMTQTASQTLREQQEDYATGGGPGGAAIAARARAITRSEAGRTEKSDAAGTAMGEAVQRVQPTVASAQQAATAARAAADAAAKGPMATEAAQIESQVAAFAYSNFGSYATDDKAKAAIESYTKALKDAAAARRDAANAGAVLVAQQNEEVSAVTRAAQGQGVRGEALRRETLLARLKVVTANGGSATQELQTFETGLANEKSDFRAAQDDAIERINGRLALNSSSPYARRQFDRRQEAVEAERKLVGTGASVTARQDAEDRQIARDREDADANRLRVLREEATLGLLVGRERREQEAVLRRTQELVARGELPAGQALLEIERQRVVALQQATEEYQKQLDRAGDLASIGPGIGASVGGGLREAFRDAFDDGTVKGETMIKALNGMATNMAMTVADALIIKPLERMTTQFAEDKIVPFLVGLIPGGGEDGGKVADAAKAASDIKNVAKGASEVKAAGSATALAAAHVKLTTVSLATTAAIQALGVAAGVSAKALASHAAVTSGDAGFNIAKEFAKNLVGGLSGGRTDQGGKGGMDNIRGSAFGNVIDGMGIKAFAFGGVANTPTYFPMAGGTGLAFESGPEAILPLKRGPDGRLGVGGGSGGGGDVQIIVNDMRSNEGSAPVEQQTTRGRDGKRVIKMTIRDEMKTAIREGAVDAPMRDTYGTPRQIVRR
jgi:tape measure domain-containing protein